MNNPLGWLASDVTAPAQEQSNNLSVVLPAALSVQHIETLHTTLQTALENNTKDAFHIDAQYVETLDSSGYQLLVSVIKTCKTKGKVCVIDQAPALLTDKLIALGDSLVRDCISET